MNTSLVTGRILLANADGTEKFTNESPGVVQLSGSNIPEAQALPIKAMASENKIGSVRQVKFPSPINVTRVNSSTLRPFADSGEYRYGVSGGKLIRRGYDVDGDTGFEEIIFTPTDGWSILATAWLYRFPNGRLLCVCRNTSLNKSGIFISDLADDDKSKVFTLVLDNMTAAPYSQWGWDVWGDMVFVSEYDGYTTAGGGGLTGNGRYIYMSRDQGQTWVTILDREDATTGLTLGDSVTHGMHFHDVAYDPWAGMVWATCGDASWSNVVYTYDFGLHWHEVFEGGIGYYDYKQFLGITATPEYIVLGTDYPGVNGIYVMRKPQPLARQGGEFTPDMLELRYLDYCQEGFIGALFTSFRYVDGYWYAVSVNTTSPIEPVVIASSNGYDWYEIYRHKRLVTRTAGGLKTFYRQGNNLYGWMYDDDNLNNKLLQIPIPTWITI